MTEPDEPQFVFHSATGGPNTPPTPDASYASEMGFTAQLLSQAQTYLSYENRDLAPQTIRNAWDEFYPLCNAVISNLACRCGMVGHDVADCRQDVWADLLERLPDLHHDPERGPFENWLYPIVHSKAVNRRRCLDRGVSQLTADALVTLADDRASPDHRSDDEELAQLVWKLLRGRLSELNLHILQLRLIEQLSSKEVAKWLGLTHDEVRQRYRRARLELQSVGAALGLCQPPLRPDEGPFCL
jgi:RNA polymerase sigma factor (sigma-70 family)